jgi:hypothetical protein
MNGTHQDSGLRERLGRDESLGEMDPVILQAFGLIVSL